MVAPFGDFKVALDVTAETIVFAESPRLHKKKWHAYLLTKVTGLVRQPGLYVTLCNPITTIPETVSEDKSMKDAAKLDTDAGVSTEATRATRYFANLRA